MTNLPTKSRTANVLPTLKADCRISVRSWICQHTWYFVNISKINHILCFAVAAKNNIRDRTIQWTMKRRKNLDDVIEFAKYWNRATSHVPVLSKERITYVWTLSKVNPANCVVGHLDLDNAWQPAGKGYRVESPIFKDKAILIGSNKVKISSDCPILCGKA